MGMFGTSQPGVTSGQSLRSDGGNNNNNSNGSGAASYSNERSSNTSSNANTANRHVSLAAGMGGGSGNGQQLHQPQPQQQQGNGNVGDRLANARAVSPRLPGSAGPGSNQFPIYSGAANGLLQGSSTNQGLGGLGLGAAPGARPGAGVRPASEYLGGGNKGQRGKEASPESEFRFEADHLPSSNSLSWKGICADWSVLAIRSNRRSDRDLVYRLAGLRGSVGRFGVCQYGSELYGRVASHREL